MVEENTFEVIGETEDKDLKIQELEQKLKETEKKLNELNHDLEQRVIERTVEVKRLLRHQIKFIDSLSHDLATPITPLVSLLPIIKEEIKEDNLIQLLDTCIRNVEYLKRVINNTRELAEISASDLFLKKEKMNDILEQILKKYDVVFKGYNIKIENNIDENLIIKTEKNKLTQLFDHVISNAVYVMTEGGTLKFNAKNVKKETGDFIQISISDTGAGLTREETDHIFEEFYKTDKSRHKLDSTGLGLSICRNIIQKHGGKIWADSHGKDTGTTIHFTIPTEESIYSRSFT